MTSGLFSCADSQPSGADSLSNDHRSVKRDHRTIDLHCHVHIYEADRIIKDVFDPRAEPLIAFSNDATRNTNKAQMQSLHLKLTSVDARLQDMDRLGIDVQALSPSPFQYCYWAPPELGLAYSRLVNDGVAQMVAHMPDRFVGLGTVPLQTPGLAVMELERVVGELGFRGVQIATNVLGEELSHERYRPFFAKAQELGVLVFMHPNGFSDGRRLADHYFSNIIGNPLDATVAVAHLIFDGVLESLPSLKLCIAHGGGFLPSYTGRMDHAHRVREDCRRCIQQLPSTYLKRLYFDTVVFNPAQLEYLIREYGADHIVLGTDYPYDMSEPDSVRFVNQLSELSKEERAAILGGNAARLLGLASGERPPMPG
jgi:aminocarboxymuconate-semialdehyde decarboxylase